MNDPWPLTTDVIAVYEYRQMPSKFNGWVECDRRHRSVTADGRRDKYSEPGRVVGWAWAKGNPPKRTPEQREQKLLADRESWHRREVRLARPDRLPRLWSPFGAPYQSSLAYALDAMRASEHPACWKSLGAEVRA